MPARPRALSAAASAGASIHGAPICSNGVSVPRPTEMFVPSIAPMPGYSVAATMFRMFGDGFTHGRPVSSNHSSRRQFFIGTTVSSAPILNSSLTSRASSPIVSPWRIGIRKYDV